MGAVLSLGRAFPDHLGLSAIGLIAPHSGLFAVQPIVLKRFTGEMPVQESSRMKPPWSFSHHTMLTASEILKLSQPSPLPFGLLARWFAACETRLGPSAELEGTSMITDVIVTENIASRILPVI